MLILFSSLSYTGHKRIILLIFNHFLMLKSITLFIFKQITCKKNWLLQIKSYRSDKYDSRLFLVEVVLS